MIHSCVMLRQLFCASQASPCIVFHSESMQDVFKNQISQKKSLNDKAPHMSILHTGEHIKLHKWHPAWWIELPSSQQTHNTHNVKLHILSSASQSLPLCYISPYLDMMPNKGNTHCVLALSQSFWVDRSRSSIKMDDARSDTEATCAYCFAYPVAF